MVSEKVKVLEAAISSASNAKDKIDAINLLAFEIRNLDTTRSIELNKQAQNISSQINYSEGKATALTNEAFCHVQITNYELALEKLYEALPIFESLKNEKGIAQVHYNLCLIYFRFSDFNKGLDSITKALAYYQKVNDIPEMARGFFQLGFLYHSLNDSTSAVEYFNQSLKLHQEMNNKAGEAAAIMGLGQSYLQQGKYEESKKYLLESMAIREQIKDWRGYAATLNAYMTLCLETGKDEEAEKISLKGVKLATELGDKMGISRFMNDLGKIYIRKNKIDEAEKILLDSLNTAEKINLRMALAPVHFSLSEIYEIKGDLPNALKHYKRFHEVKEELQNTDAGMKAKSAQLVTKIESAQKEAEINRLKNVELKNAYDEIAEKNKDITDSINYAKKIQQALLSSDDLLKQHLKKYFVLFRPKDIVSGDFYWSVTKNESFYLAICDSTGHGVPGAFMSLLNISFLNEAINEKNISAPNEVFNYVRKRLIESFSYDGAQDGMEGILLKIKTENEKLKIEYAAAHNAPVLVKNGKLLELPHDKMPVGEGENKADFTLHSITLEQNDSLYLYTDGYADQFGGEKQKKFKYKQLHELLLSISDKPLPEQKNILEQNFESWKGTNPQTDDVMVIGIKL